MRDEIQLAHSLWTAIEAREYHRMVVLVVSRLAELKAHRRRFPSGSSPSPRPWQVPTIRKIFDEALEALGGPRRIVPLTKGFRGLESESRQLRGRQWWIRVGHQF